MDESKRLVDNQISALGAALTGLIRALHENGVISQSKVLTSITHAAAGPGPEGNQEQVILLAKYASSLRKAFPDS